MRCGAGKRPDDLALEAWLIDDVKDRGRECLLEVDEAAPDDYSYKI
jgi:hypothetical protein